MPPHQASADPAGTAPPSSRPRMVSVTGVAGFGLDRILDGVEVLVGTGG